MFGQATRQFPPLTEEIAPALPWVYSDRRSPMPLPTPRLSRGENHRLKKQAPSMPGSAAG